MTTIEFSNKLEELVKQAPEGVNLLMTCSTIENDEVLHFVKGVPVEISGNIASLMEDSPGVKNMIEISLYALDVKQKSQL